MDLVDGFARLYAGRTDAYGTGEGRVVRAAHGIPRGLYQEHLDGLGSGLGIFPLRDDGTVSWAAIDLDAPDFEAAREMQRLLPGTTWIERSRSGNAHVLSFFAAPIEAWVPRGIMQAVLRAMDMERVEVFPKQPELLPGMVGNYLNLAYHGAERPILADFHEGGWPVEHWVPYALYHRNDPDDWRRRAKYLGVEPPRPRAEAAAEFGTSPVLHECALYIIEGARSGERPLAQGHRSVVLFNLAKQLLHWQEMDPSDALELLHEVNATADEPLPGSELRRIFSNAASGRWTSTGCDDPLMQPYVHPDCPIARRA